MIKMSKIFLRSFILKVLLVGLMVQSLGVNLYGGGNELPEKASYKNNNNLFASGYESDFKQVNFCPEDDEEDLEQRLYNPKESKETRSRIRENKIKRQKELRKKQALALFFCVLIVGGAIVIPSLMPFLYVICCSSNKSASLRDYSRLSRAGINQNVLPNNDTIVLSEALFLNNQLIQDLNTDTPPSECNAVMSKNEPHIALVNTEALDQISDAVCNSGITGMCCIVRSNSKLKCCQDDICREVSFFQDRKNTYLINNEKIFVITPHQEIKTHNISKEQSFNIYDYLMRLNRAYNNWVSFEEEELFEDFKEVLQEVRKIFTELLNKVKNKMPGLLEREIVALYICENDLPLSIGQEITGKKELSIDDSLLGKNLFSIIRYDGVKSRACKLDFDSSLCALSILKIDYSEIVKVKLTDSDIERMLAHELGHIIQTKNPITFYFFDDDEYNESVVFSSYIARNTEIDADLKSQLAADASQLNFDTVIALLRLDFLSLNYFNRYVTIDKKFNCFETMADAPKDLQPLPEHPDLRCRIAYVLSLSEAMEKMHKFFKNLEHPEMGV